MSKSDYKKVVVVKCAIKPTGQRLYFSITGAIHAGEFDHPEKVAQGLGIKYEDAVCWAVGDCWIFHRVTLGNVELPSYMHIIKETESDYEVAK
jgi:hypothetical protein